jgi:hypothetical protein
MPHWAGLSVRSVRIGGGLGSGIFAAGPAVIVPDVLKSRLSFIFGAASQKRC